MSKIIVLAGSPRLGGNTDLLVDMFVKGATKQNEVEVISVHDYQVNPCTGCNFCFTREGNLCYQGDDMTKIYAKLAQADILIIASPVFFTESARNLRLLLTGFMRLQETCLR